MKQEPAERLNSRGLTIIELAMTISILGMMFFFALKGRVLIESMKSVAVSYQMEHYRYQVYTYQVDNRALPGDDPNATRRWPGRPEALTNVGLDSLVSLSGNGKLDGKLYEASNPDGEPFAVWRDLRLATKIEGDPDLIGISAMPENPFGGFYGFDQGNLGQTTGSICATRIPGRAAQLIDERIDDGKIGAGKLVATSKFSIEQSQHFDEPDTTPYDIDKEYIICLPWMP